MFAGNPTKRVHSPRPSRKPLPRPGRSQYLKQRRDVPAAPETLSTASLRTDDGSPYALIGACVARQPGCCGSSRRVAEKRHELPAPHSINSSAMEQERLRDRQPKRLGGRCLPGGLCCNLTFPFLAAVRRRPAPSALRNVKSRTPAQFGEALYRP